MLSNCTVSASIHHRRCRSLRRCSNRYLNILILDMHSFCSLPLHLSFTLFSGLIFHIEWKFHSYFLCCCCCCCSNIWTTCCRLSWNMLSYSITSYTCLWKFVCMLLLLLPLSCLFPALAFRGRYFVLVIFAVQKKIAVPQYCHRPFSVDLHKKNGMKSVVHYKNACICRVSVVCHFLLFFIHISVFFLVHCSPLCIRS